MRRRQKEKWKKIFVLVCGTVVLIFGLRALGGLARSLWQRLIPQDAPLARQIGERLLLNDRTVFSYLKFHEENRGPFRFISEHILCHSRYVIAQEDGDKGNIISGEEWEDNSCDGTENIGGEMEKGDTIKEEGDGKEEAGDFLKENVERG